jgi:hypothetical protein
MAITEETRHRLFQRLEQVLGADEATTLMEHLPPIGWADVATKRDLDALGAATRQDVEALRAEMGHRFDSFGTEMNLRFDSFGTEMDHRFANVDQRFENVDRRFGTLESSMDLRFDAFEHRFQATLHRELRTHTYTMLAAFTALSGVILAATRLH